MARIAGINIPPHQHAEIGLTAIMALVAPRTQDLRSLRHRIFKKVKGSDGRRSGKIRDQIAQFTIEGDLRRETTMNIKRLMDIGCYRGFRHRRGLPCAAGVRAPMPVPARPAQKCSCSEEIKD